ncbi:hypothetical protein CPT_Matisse17 [Klebsiella phage Matisse]|uniref:Uncharacterized protein n=2 Tax=Viruses TaxID=10239 RepID=A0A0K1LP16_9CAUD|nr:hypothetical protein CPT_Matisse17 [Klebsiella phage Matisse]AKU44321.1 hypothetical protein CPT_Matisse17 [Klebsiella phage Matisse]
MLYWVLRKEIDMNFTKFEIRLLITLAFCGAVSLISLLTYIAVRTTIWLHDWFTVLDTIKG